MSWTERINAKLGERLHLVRGKDQGRQAWYYVLVDRLKMNIFLAMIHQGSLNLEDYGKILYSGWGENPPEHIVSKIKEEYDH
ncbi:MAG: hypothetical protein COA78_31840 [Blastopirellula sp.]|nr:MAG: hypothetical protein COA78_31840 [Blastopirellula sp.]